MNQNIINLDTINLAHKENKTSHKASGPVLRQVDVKIVSQEECNNDYASLNEGSLITPDTICATNFGKDRYRGIMYLWTIFQEHSNFQLSRR